MQDQKNAPVIAQQVAILSESAAELARRGQKEDAARIYEQIFEIAPYHLAALNFLAMQAVERGDYDLGLQLLDRSLQVNPSNFLTHLNMGVVYKRRGEHERALQALDKALQLNPSFPQILLQKGAVLEQLGRNQEALRVYLKAFKEAPALRYADHSLPPLPAHILRGAGHADEFIVRHTMELMEAALAPVHATHGAEAMKRVDEFLELHTGKRTPQYQHAAQRPGFLYFPGLEAQPFFERSGFDWCAKLEAATAGIRAELQALLQEPDALKPYVQLAVPDAAEWTALNGSLQWGSLHLYKGGERIEENCRRCPVTLEAIERLPLARTPGQSPEVFFSILKRGARIPPHHGLTNYKVAVHLPLMIPSDCAIRVGNETRSWNEGQCLIFDDSFKHEAWNNSSEPRAVLILDIWNPQLTAAERSALPAILGVLGELARMSGDAG